MGICISSTYVLKLDSSRIKRADSISYSSFSTEGNYSIWKVLRTESEAKINFIKDGTLDASICDAVDDIQLHAHLELRTILEDLSCVPYIKGYAEAVNRQHLINFWLEIQMLRTDELTANEKYVSLELVYKSYIIGEVSIDNTLLMTYIGIPTAKLEELAALFQSNESFVMEIGRKFAGKPSALLVSKIDLIIEKLIFIQCKCFYFIVSDIYNGFRGTKQYSNLCDYIVKKYNYVIPNDFDYFDRLGRYE